ncbi:15072_t:CDS:10 [Acaulospora colombiana]|uniref:15072_t:CDS:1 n=1 Tax=Acaulospora colombiana TaxID=27376 RepID=A0ACA9L929_9GLOM|nr:15072_t:CDS:10 [Acaulospora colombiana]
MSDAGQWCLIESDPGVFTELIKRLNVEGTQVEEVWSLDDQTLDELKYGGNDSSKLHPDADLSIDNRVYFAKQVINNACATQAILSILLNCPSINLGTELENFRDFTKDFDSYYKGLTISNSTLIRSVHNSFARSDPFFMDQTDVSSSEKEDIFHFISYVPVHGALYELDGLSEGPVNLGPCTEDDWLEKVRPVIHERMARYASAEIRFNLLALIKNREDVYQARINEIDLNVDYANREANSEPKEMKVEVKNEGPPPKAPPKEPPSFEFMSDMPAISAQDLDILKLTAQFVARNGRQFMTALSQREQRNYQFDFLRPNHSLCNYFTKLVEQYAKVLVPPKNLNDKLKSNVENKYQILELAYASIDWHDFVIVETVEFTEADETIDLPPPMSIIELENMTLAQKKMASVSMAETQEDKAAEIDMEMDDDVDMEEEDDDQDAAEDEDQDHDATLIVTEIKPPDASAPMKIVKDYTPKAYAPKTITEKPTLICPRCKQAIPVDEMDDHVRIELLDPKWKEQKMAAEAKKKESNLLQEGTDVAKNLKAFSGYRSDIFGNEETEIGRKHASPAQQSIFQGYPTHNPQVIPGMPPVAYPGYVGSSVPFAHQLQGYITNAGVAQPSQARPIPPIPQQFHRPPLSGRPMEDEMDPFAMNKRVKMDPTGILISEEEWMITHQGPISIHIQCPTIPEKPEWSCHGQILILENLSLATLVSTVKDKIFAQLNFPAGKQKLTIGGAVMKNQVSLAYYNIEDGGVIGLAIKDRGKK